MKRCINCKTMLEDDELFCHECGTKQEIEVVVAQEEEPTTPLEKKCIHCGETIEEDSAFCPYCGESQALEEVKGSEPDAEKEPVSEEKTEPKQEESPAPEENSEPEDTPVQEIPEERPHYDWEDEPKSKKWIWILLLVLLAGAGASWYFFSQNCYSLNDAGTIVEAVDSDSIAVVPEEEEMVPTSPLAFLEQFYKGDYKNEEYIKQHVTANVINKLKRDYEYECPSGDCLATWVFTAYPPGSDLYLEEGPIITESKEGGKYSVYYRYYSQGQSGKIYKPRGLLVSVTQIDGKYLISDYELEMPDIVENQDGLANNKDGQYYLQDGRLFLHLIKKGSEIEGDFNFRDGTYVSATYEFSCIIDDENNFCTDVYMNGHKKGMIEGTFENGVMKVDVGVDNKYSDTYELKVDKQNGNND